MLGNKMDFNAFIFLTLIASAFSRPQYYGCAPPCYQYPCVCVAPCAPCSTTLIPPTPTPSPCASPPPTPAITIRHINQRFTDDDNNDVQSRSGNPKKTGMFASLLGIPGAIVDTLLTGEVVV